MWGKLLAGVAVVALAAFLIVQFGDARADAGRLAERVAWKDVVAQKERELADLRVTAAERYAERLAARQPLIVRSTDTVRLYAETDAGRAPCRAAERVHGIDALDATLFGFTPATPKGSAGTMPTDAAAAPG